MENSRNIVLAMLLSALVLFGGQWASEKFFPAPKSAPTAAATPQATATGAPPVAAAPGAIKPQPASVILGLSQRVAIETPKLKGSINLTGGQLDDLVLTKYTQTLAKDSPAVRLFSPLGTAESYYAGFGWSGGPGVAVPTEATIWTADAAKLEPGKPVTLSWDNGSGLLFQLRYAIDANYMFTVDQIVTNKSAAPVALQDRGWINRAAASTTKEAMLTKADGHGTNMMHVGPIGAFEDSVHYDINYDHLNGGQSKSFNTTGGWLGFGETYWLSALVPAGNVNVATSFNGLKDSYLAQFQYPQKIVSPGAPATMTSKLFAGAKEIALLKAYDDGGIPLFEKAVDWGWFEIIEKPIEWTLRHLFALFGNFGLAIIGLTFIVRGLMFPIAQRQFESMARMRAVQPKMKEIQERYKDDKQRQQQETMKLYQTEKINPIGGCLPIFLQIPVFYGLYKVLNLSIEMRHQPFALWIHDLSAPDPATVLNLFGALPFTPTGFFAIGVLPIILGITMYLQFKLNPAPMDPAQQQIFALMPWVMMVMMAPFAAGLQLYWSVSNILTIAQQKWLYSRHPALKEPVKAT